MSRLHLPVTPIVIGAAVLAALYFGFSTYYYVVHNYQLAEDEASIRSDIAELERQHARLTSVRDYLRSDEYVEYVARNTLGLVRPGETLVIVSSSAPPAAATATPAAETHNTSPWWEDLFAGAEPAPTPTAP